MCGGGGEGRVRAGVETGGEMGRGCWNKPPNCYLMERAKSGSIDCFCDFFDCFKAPPLSLLLCKMGLGKWGNELRYSEQRPLPML